MGEKTSSGRTLEGRDPSIVHAVAVESLAKSTFKRLPQANTPGNLLAYDVLVRRRLRVLSVTATTVLEAECEQVL